MNIKLFFFLSWNNLTKIKEHRGNKWTKALKQQIKVVKSDKAIKYDPSSYRGIDKLEGSVPMTKSKVLYFFKYLFLNKQFVTVIPTTNTDLYSKMTHKMNSKTIQNKNVFTELPLEIKFHIQELEEEVKTLRTRNVYFKQLIDIIKENQRQERDALISQQEDDLTDLKNKWLDKVTETEASHMEFKRQVLFLNNCHSKYLLYLEYEYHSHIKKFAELLKDDMDDEFIQIQCELLVVASDEHVRQLQNILNLQRKTLLQIKDDADPFQT